MFLAKHWIPFAHILLCKFAHQYCKMHPVLPPEHPSTTVMRCIPKARHMDSLRVGAMQQTDLSTPSNSSSLCVGLGKGDSTAFRGTRTASVYRLKFVGGGSD